MNLIDSPGHVEFSSEVWTGLKVTDGAFILIDCLEGVSSQTYTVLKQAFEQDIKMILILNKVDRLIHELQMTPSDVYKQLFLIVE